MNFKLITLVAVFAGIITAQANANLLMDVYAGATIGAGGASIYNDHHTSSASAQSFGGIMGIDIPFLRAEVEYSYLNQHDLSVNVGMLNAYAKMPAAFVQPYFGAGVGMTFDGSVDDASDVTIKHGAAYQGMLGLTFDIPALPIKIDAEAQTIYVPDICKYMDGAHEITPDALQYQARLKMRYIF